MKDIKLKSKRILLSDNCKMLESKYFSYEDSYKNIVSHTRPQKRLGHLMVIIMKFKC